MRTFVLWQDSRNYGFGYMRVVLNAELSGEGAAFLVDGHEGPATRVVDAHLVPSQEAFTSLQGAGQKSSGVRALPTLSSHLTMRGAPAPYWEYSDCLVFVDGRAVGRLRPKDFEPFRIPFTRLWAAGYVIQAHAAVRVYRHHPDTKLFFELCLPDARLCLPINPPPDVVHVVLPHSSYELSVTNVSDYMANILQLIGGDGAYCAHGTLHAMSAPRSVVEIRVNGLAVGRLSDTAALQYLPLIQLCVNEGVVPVVRTYFFGNELSLKVGVYAARPRQLDIRPFSRSNPVLEEYERAPKHS